MNALHIIIVGILVFVPLPGGSVEVFTKDGKECHCFPIRTIPAVYITYSIDQKKVII